MQISQVTQIELALLINGLRSFIVADHAQQVAQAKLLKQLEGELTQRFGLKLRQPGERAEEAAVYMR